MRVVVRVGPLLRREFRVEQAGVTVSLPAVRRAWRAGNDELWLQVKTKVAMPLAVAAAEAALELANAEAEAAAQAAGAAGEWVGDALVLGSDVALSPGGPLVFLGVCDDADALEVWVTTFAAVLSQAGVVGSVAPVRSASSPIGNDLSMRLCAGVTLPLRWEKVAADQAAGVLVLAHWYVEDDVTDAVIDAFASWCLAAAGNVYLSHHSVTMRVEAAGARPLVRAALRKDPPVNLTCAVDASTFRVVHFGALGEVTLMVRDRDAGWAGDVAALEEALRAVAPYAEQGLVRTGGLSMPWGLMVNAVPPVPPYGGQELSGGTGTLEWVRHLLASRVLDAYGVQLLTDAHLAHARDLSGWDVEPLGEGRHLVRARDLAAWFAQDQPTDTALTQARSDFADMLLTPDTHRAAGPGPFGEPPNYPKRKRSRGAPA